MNTVNVEARFRAATAAVGPAPGDTWVVAVSGGLDSVVLLHLLRFGAPADVRLVVAHFDHAMRLGSAEDARWVQGLCRAWGVDVRVARATHAPASEASARDARYAFLERVRSEAGARSVLTAHHADDQAETVLFRALRGSGQAGLAGMAVVRGRIFRPLLAIWREELEAYASAHRLSWRDDPTNESLGYARNALRHRVLPEIEQWVAPGARRALVRLADLSRQDEAGWESVLPMLLGPLAVHETEGVVRVERAGLAALHPAVRARVIRALAERIGGSLDEAATRRAVDFAGTAESGRSLDLGGGLALRRELDRLAIGVPPHVPADRPLTIPDVGPGAGSALLGGRDVPVSWALGVVTGGLVRTDLDADALRFPLCVRAREPGDRIRVSVGSRSVTKKVKKLLLERRIPESERGSLALLVDAQGDVLWIPGVARASDLTSGGTGLGIGVG